MLHQKKRAFGPNLQLPSRTWQGIQPTRRASRHHGGRGAGGSAVWDVEAAAPNVTVFRHGGGRNRVSRVQSPFAWREKRRRRKSKFNKSEAGGGRSEGGQFGGLGLGGKDCGRDGAESGVRGHGCEAIHEEGQAGPGRDAGGGWPTLQCWSV